MYIRRVTRYHQSRSSERNPSFLRQLQLRGGAVLVTLGMLAIGILLFKAPFTLEKIERDNLSKALDTAYATEIYKVEELWIKFPDIPTFARGDEPEVKAFLAKDPLLVAICDRLDPSRLWVREGDRLVRAGKTFDAELYRRWIDQSDFLQRFQWCPLMKENADPGMGPAIVLRNDAWVAIRRWSPGSRAVEEMLRIAFGKDAKLRIGITQNQRGGRLLRKLEPWGAEPNYQADPARLVNAPFRVLYEVNALPGWVVVAVPFSQQERVLKAEVEKVFFWAAVGALFVGGSLAMGFYLRNRARQKAVLDADRLASLTHSLKTPLAVLKFRCDSIRLGRLDRDQADAELIKVGEEVDHLTRLIENGLQAIRGVKEGGPQDVVSPSWLAEVASDLSPVFEAEGRSLDLQLTPECGKAALSSLRTSLLTVLENALFHGEGRVCLASAKQRGRIQIRISDEGGGLGRVQLNAIGKPFLRLRSRGKEGFEREGQGLGLSLLVQVAQKEGWGLSFASGEGEGFTAIIEIRAV